MNPAGKPMSDKDLKALELEALGPEGDDGQWHEEPETVLPVTHGDEPYSPEPTIPPLESNIQVVMTIRITKTGQFLVSGGSIIGEIRLHSEWQLAALLTDMSKHGKLQNLKPFSKSQTYEEWLAAGNAVTVIKPSETKPVPKDEAGKVTITLEDLGL